MLGTLEVWVVEIPPIKQPMRFGNMAYRSWHERLCTEAPELIATVVPDAMRGAVVSGGRCSRIVVARQVARALPPHRSTMPPPHHPTTPPPQHPNRPPRSS